MSNNKEIDNDKKWRGRSLELERASAGNDQSRFGARCTGGERERNSPPPRSGDTARVKPRFLHGISGESAPGGRGLDARDALLRKVINTAMFIKEIDNDEKWRGRSLELERASSGSDQSHFGARCTGGEREGNSPHPAER